MDKIGFIYKIVCNITGETYYGSTFRDLNLRLAEHVNNYNLHTRNGYCNYVSSFGIIQRGNYGIEMVEALKINEPVELRIRERFYFDNFECVNQNRPFVSIEEANAYYENNKEVRKSYQKKYRVENIDGVRETSRKYRETEAYKESQRKFKEENKDKMREYQRIYREAHK